MQIRRMAFAVVIVVALSAVWALGVQRGDVPPAGQDTVYRVTPWPDNTPDRPYHQQVERYLNRMAAEGWRFSTELTGQGARMMVFQREAGR